MTVGTIWGREKNGKVFRFVGLTPVKVVKLKRYQKNYA